MKISEKWMDLKSILSKVTQTQKEKAVPSLSQACLSLSCMYVCMTVCMYVYICRYEYSTKFRKETKGR